MNETETLPSLETEILRYEAKRSAALRFAPDLEQRFQRETNLSRARTLVMQGMVSLCAYDFLIVGDYFMSPAHVLRAAIVRFGIMTPLVLFTAMLVRRKRGVVLREVAASILCVLSALSVLYLQHDVSATVAAQAQMGLVLVLLVANCLVRIDLPYAIVTSTLIVIVDVAALFLEKQLPLSQKMVSSGMLFWVAVLTLTANFTLARERRFSYLIQLRSRLQRSLLADANAELLALSSTDRLTGLPNRRAYDARLEELWQVCLQKKEPLSALMVDVDHFKKLNDTHGHQYGDRVLQRIASLLQQALRGEHDFVARFGGEEFVVLLPNADPETAIVVAERVRTLVQVAGSPALQRDTPLSPQDIWATVSCGVATAWPAANFEPARLISAADSAMYRAKKEGRNRVRSAAPVQASGKVTVFPAAAARS